MKLEKTYRVPSQGANDSNRESGSSAREIKEEVCETPVACHKVGISDSVDFFLIFWLGEAGRGFTILTNG